MNNQQITIVCPKCGTSRAVSPSLAGLSTKCIKCWAEVIVPITGTYEPEISAAPHTTSTPYKNNGDAAASNIEKPIVILASNGGTKRNDFKEIAIATPIVAVIGTIIGILLAGAYQIGIFVPLFIYLFAALIGGAIGWVIGLPFHKGRLFRTIGSYGLGLVSSSYGMYRATMNEMIRGYRDSILNINPSLSESEWYALREAAIPEAIPHAILRGLFILFIVLCWIGVYWGIRIIIRKILAPSNHN